MCFEPSVQLINRFVTNSSCIPCMMNEEGASNHSTRDCLKGWKFRIIGFISSARAPGSFLQLDGEHLGIHPVCGLPTTICGRTGVNPCVFKDTLYPLLWTAHARTAIWRQTLTILGTVGIVGMENWTEDQYREWLVQPCAIDFGSGGHLPLLNSWSIVWAWTRILLKITM